MGPVVGIPFVAWPITVGGWGACWRLSADEWKSLATEFGPLAVSYTQSLFAIEQALIGAS